MHKSGTLSGGEPVESVPDLCMGQHGVSSCPRVARTRSDSCQTGRNYNQDCSKSSTLFAYFTAMQSQREIRTTLSRPAALVMSCKRGVYSMPASRPGSALVLARTGAVDKIIYKIC